MLKKTITYEDYNGNSRTEDFYFHLNKSELLEMELSTEGGLVEMMDRLVQAQDIPALIKVYKKLVRKAYGVKSPDGKRFVKSDELFDAFSQTEAYSDLFFELSTNATAAAEFVNGVIPSKLASEMESNMPELMDKLPDSIKRLQQ